MSENTGKIAVGAGAALLIAWLLMRDRKAGAATLPTVLPPAYTGLGPAKTSWGVTISVDGILLTSAVQAYDLEGEPIPLPVIVEDDYWIVNRSRDLTDLDVSEQDMRRRSLIDDFMALLSGPTNFELTIAQGASSPSAASVAAMTDALDKRVIPYSTKPGEN